MTRFEFERGQETRWHEHDYDYVISAITNCLMMLENSDGTNSTAEIKGGDSYTRKAGIRHNVINSSDKQMSFI